MNRYTLGIITFFVTFAFSTSLVGLLFGFPKLGHSHSSDSHVRRSIQRVLETDIRMGELRRRSEIRLARQMKRSAREGVLSESETRAFDTQYSAIVKRYADNSSAINISRTPADFQYAWNRHMEEWNKQTKASQNGGLSARSAGKDNTSEINATWFQVLRIAKRYGVPIKARYNR